MVDSVDHPRIEKEQEEQRHQIGQLTKDVSALTADVRTMLETQRGLATRLNRPTQWGVLVSAVALVAVILGLVTGPMKEEIGDLEDKVTLETNRNIELHIMFNERQTDQIKIAVENQTNIAWLMMLEGRLNSRLHGGE